MKNIRLPDRRARSMSRPQISVSTAAAAAQTAAGRQSATISGICRSFSDIEHRVEGDAHETGLGEVPQAGDFLRQGEGDSQKHEDRGRGCAGPEDLQQHERVSHLRAPPSAFGYQRKCV